MIRSVGAGSTGLNNQSRRKAQPEASIPFPKVGSGGQVGTTQEQPAKIRQESQTMMVGVKPKSQLKSIFDETTSVVKLNADGDRLEVSKRAITLAKDKLFG
ncbi:DNA primase [Solibacillus sp. MA9]|uniref:DNA primase n=1 Tax=Solibacillus palustris TaxID=2908203 RepID=A0ABS9UCC6_9BACL|nr:DNA primase [Solibacillus sp. MA9]MCH7321995.1 DNA primase [Solibacillus sp. MA9]